MSQLRMVFAAALSAAVGAGASGQTGTVDQTSPRTNAWYNVDASFLIWQQEIHCGLAGTFEGVQLTLVGPAGAQVDVRLRLGNAWNTQTEAFSARITKSVEGPEEVFVDMTAAGITVAPGDVVVMETQGNDTGCGLVGHAYPPLYAPQLWLTGSVFADEQWRHGFASFVIAIIRCLADFDGDGFVTGLDFDAYVAAFEAGDISADFDGDGFVTGLDFDGYVAAFEFGCD